MLKEFLDEIYEKPLWYPRRNSATMILWMYFSKNSAEKFEMQNF